MYKIMDLNRLFSTFQETVWSLLKITKNLLNRKIQQRIVTTKTAPAVLACFSTVETVKACEQRMWRIPIFS